MLVKILIVIMIIIYFILYKLATMNPLGWYPPHLMDNTDTLYLGPGLATCSVVVFLDFCFFVFISLPMCQSVCLSAGLFVFVHQFTYVSASLCVCGSLCNPSQVFKKSLLMVYLLIFYVTGMGFEINWGKLKGIQRDPHGKRWFLQLFMWWMDCRQQIKDLLLDKFIIHWGKTNSCYSFLILENPKC